MHHIGITLDHHLLGEFDATGASHSTDVVTAQVDQHQVLGDFLGIGQQVLFQGQVSLLVGTTRAGAGNRAHGDQAIFQAHQHLRRAADHVEVAEVEEVHIRRRVDATQRAVQINRRRLERDRHALRDHHLHAVSSENVLLDRLDCIFVVIAFEAGDKVRLGTGRRGQVHAQARGNRLTQLVQDVLQARLALLQRIGVARINQHDGVHLAGQVVEHHHRIGHHQQDIRCTQGIGVNTLGQFGLDVAHAVIAKVANQAAVEARQAGQRRYLVAIFELLDKGQWVFAVMTLHFDTVDADGHVMLVRTQHGACRQANDGVTPPLLTALHGLQQVGVGLIGQLQINGQRSVEIHQGFAGNRNAVIAGSG